MTILFQRLCLVSSLLKQYVCSLTRPIYKYSSGAVAQYRSGAVGAVAQWRGGAVARWRGGAVARWRGGAVAQWAQYRAHQTLN